MSPEQASGGSLDPRTDIFSPGVVLYEMVAGRRPFQGVTRSEVLRALLTDEPAPVRSSRDDVPIELESILRKALHKDPSDRYRSADDLLRDLGSLRNRLEYDRRRPEPGIQDADVEEHPGSGPKRFRLFSFLGRRKRMVSMLLFQKERRFAVCNHSWRLTGTASMAEMSRLPRWPAGFAIASFVSEFFTASPGLAGLR